MSEVEGWIKLHRQFIKWEWYDDSNTMRLFVHCLLLANHKPKVWRGIQIKKGQFITSYNKLSADLNLSIQQIRTALEKLQKTGEITISSTSKYSTVTVCKYYTYQKQEKSNNTHNNSQSTSEQQSNNNQITTTKNDKNVKNDKNNTTREDDFISLLENVKTHEEAFEIWNKYRKKKGKHASLYEKEVLIKKTWKDMSPKEVSEAILYTVENGWVTLQYPEEEEEEMHGTKLRGL